MANSATWVGLTEANRALRQLPAFARPRVQTVMDRTGFRVSQRAHQLVRRRTGLLAEKIRWESRPRTLGAVVGVDPVAFYWKFVEYGTVNMGAHPFMRPAAESERDAHQRDIVTALEQAGYQVEVAAGGRLL